MKYIFCTAVIIATILFDFDNTHARIINIPDDHETIQGGIDASEDGDTVLVQPGSYHHNINFEGKAITLGSLFLITGMEVFIDSTIIGWVTFDHEEDENSILIGFSIIYSYIRCEGSSPTLTYLKIRDFRQRGGIVLEDASPSISHVSVSGGRGEHIAGIYCMGDCEPVVSYTSLYDNMGWCHIGCGIYCSGGCLILDHVTIFGNFCYNNDDDRGCGMGIFDVSRSSQVILENCIVMGGEQGLNIYAGSIEVSYSNLEGGQEGITCRELNWGDGNIDVDPLFVDPDNGDFRLTWEDFPVDDETRSPCIDSGNPDDPEEPDGTRADMGAHHYFQGGILQGYVLDADDDEPLIGALVNTSTGFDAETDSSGFWRIQNSHAFDFELSASIQGYCDSTLINLHVDHRDTLDIIFRLLHPEFNPDLYNIVTEIDSGQLRELPINICNDGNSDLFWEAHTQLREDRRAEIWTLHDTIAVSQQLNDNYLYGIAIVNDTIFVSGGNGPPGAFEPNMIYRLDLEGNLVDSFEQFGHPGRDGISSLTWDGFCLWGLLDGWTVQEFTTDGELIHIFGLHHYRQGGITWDNRHEILWIANDNNPLLGFDYDGNLIREIPIPGGIRHVQLSYCYDMLDDYNLILIGSSTNWSRHVLLKINPENGDVFEMGTFDYYRYYSDSYISRVYDKYNWIAASLIHHPEEEGGDLIEFRQFMPFDRWMSIDPQSGSLQHGQDADVFLTLDADGLIPEIWEGELAFSHNAVGGETILPITLTVVDPDAVDEKERPLPEKFGITDVFPNPFNSTTTVRFSLPWEGDACLKVYDLAGRMVEELIKGRLQPGRYSFSWKADGLPSGLYLIELESGNEIQREKAVLTR